MKRVFLLLATVSALSVTLPAAAQSVETSPRAVADQRPAIGTTAIEQRLRDRGVPESDIGVSIAQIRAWLAAGASPARIRNYLNGLGDDPVRPNVPTVTPSRPAVAATPAVPATPVVRGRAVTRPETVAGPVDVQRPATTVRPIAATPAVRGTRITRPQAGN